MVVSGHPTRETIMGLVFAVEILAGEPWLPTPLLPAQVIGSRLGTELWLTRKDCSPVGSFKLWGGLVSMARRAAGLSEAGVYVASAGNYGLAMALAGQRHGVKVTVVVPRGATPSKLERIRLCGAGVIEHGEHFDAAKEFALETAAEVGAAFWEDGVIEEMALGAATIASELLTLREPWDCVLAPIGNGSLIKGVASVFKAESPETRVIGLVPTGAPSMAQAIMGRSWDESAPINTTADGLAVRVPIRGIVEELKSLVDEVWLVREESLLPAVRCLMELDHREDVAGRRVAAILTGSHLRPSLIPEVLRAVELIPPGGRR